MESVAPNIEAEQRYQYAALQTILLLPAPIDMRLTLRLANWCVPTACQDIGLILGIDGWEYPIWVALQQYGSPSLRIRHVGITNISRKPAGSRHNSLP